MGKDAVSATHSLAGRQDVGQDLARRWGWLVALGAGSAWLLAAAVSRVSPDPDYWDCNSSWDYILNGLDLVTFFLSAAAIWALHAGQRGAVVGYGRWAAIAAGVGAIAAGINNPIEHCADVEILGLVLWAPSTMVWILGLVVLGVATLASRVLPNWTGPVLIAGTVLSAATWESWGVVTHGLMWIVVACALWLPEHQRTESALEP